jgi:predicted nucleotidyltransferase
MSRKPATKNETSTFVDQADIQRYAKRIVSQFQPDKIILFGSYAYGQPTETSDVDILVVMPARNEIDQSIRIWQTLEAPFPLDLIVRTPKNLAWRLKEGDWFLREIMDKGKILYEKADGSVGAKSRSRLAVGPRDSKSHRSTP